MSLAQLSVRVGHLAQQCVEMRAVRAVLNRVHPYEHPIETAQLFPYLVDGIVGVDDWFGFYAQLVECSKGVGENLRAADQGRP